MSESDGIEKVCMCVTFTLSLLKSQPTGKKVQKNKECFTFKQLIKIHVQC